MIIVLLLILRMMLLPSPVSHACLQTVPGGTPSPGGTTTTTTTTTTTVAPSACCGPVPLVNTQSNFPDGIATFQYNSDTCRTTAVATCSTSDASLDLYAAIVGNEVNYLEYAQDSATTNFVCQDGSWTYTAQGSTLVLTQVECILTNPPTAGG